MLFQAWKGEQGEANQMEWPGMPKTLFVCKHSPKELTKAGEICFK